jgi:hypothetical protein
MRITENDIDTRPFDHDDTMTAEQWWAEFYANACCPNPRTAARTGCACGGSAQVPMTISRLLMKNHDEEVF